MIENNYVVGAFNDEELIGFAFMSLYGTIKQRHKCSIWGAFVKPEYRSKSVGKNMRLFLFEEAKKLNMTHCISSIAADNPASLAMHTGVGYEIMYVESKGLKHRDDTFSDIIHLIKKL
jgi:L-amino acid N-acyltransferase YncA